MWSLPPGGRLAVEDLAQRAPSLIKTTEDIKDLHEAKQKVVDQHQEQLHIDTERLREDQITVKSQQNKVKHWIAYKDNLFKEATDKCNKASDERDRIARALHQAEQDRISSQTALKAAKDDVERTSDDLTEATATISFLNSAWADNRLLLIRNEWLGAIVSHCKMDHSDIDDLRKQLFDLQTLTAELRPCKLLFDDAKRLQQTNNAMIQDLQHQRQQLLEDLETANAEREKLKADIEDLVADEDLDAGVHDSIIARRDEKIKELDDKLKVIVAERDNLKEALKVLRAEQGSDHNKMATKDDSLGGFVIPLNDAMSTNFESHPLPNSIKQQLRTRFQDWNSRAGFRWVGVKPRGRRCMESRVSHRKSVWKDGLGYACDECEKCSHLCIVVDDDADRLLLLPLKAAEKDGHEPTQSICWQR